MRFKVGIVMWKMHPRLEEVLDDIDEISRAVCGRDGVITSARDGRHSSKSLHYSGAAIDLRTRDLSAATRKTYREALATRLGDDFDVLLEPDHIHIEFDPR